jgi:hypothetical protein
MPRGGKGKLSIRANCQSLSGCSCRDPSNLSLASRWARCTFPCSCNDHWILKGNCSCSCSPAVEHLAYLVPSKLCCLGNPYFRQFSHNVLYLYSTVRYKKQGHIFRATTVLHLMRNWQRDTSLAHSRIRDSYWPNKNKSRRFILGPGVSFCTSAMNWRCCRWD